MTPKILTREECETEVLSISSEQLSTLAKVAFVPVSRTSVLSLLSLRKLEDSQHLISIRQSHREVDERVELSLVGL